MPTQSFNERRSGQERRKRHDGPPPDAPERRLILARRTLNLGNHSVASWLSAPSTTKPGKSFR